MTALGLGRITISNQELGNRKMEEPEEQLVSVDAAAEGAPAAASDSVKANYSNSNKSAAAPAKKESKQRV